MKFYSRDSGSSKWYYLVDEFRNKLHFILTKLVNGLFIIRLNHGAVYMADSLLITFYEWRGVMNKKLIFILFL